MELNWFSLINCLLCDMRKLCLVEYFIQKPKKKKLKALIGIRNYIFEQRMKVSD